MLRPWSILFVALFALSCSGTDGDEPMAVTTTSSTTTTAAPTTTTTSATSTSSTTTSSTSTTAGTEAMAYFASPSSNIRCALHPDWGVRCDIDDMSWTPPPQPADCDLDWGNVLTVGDEAAFGCVGDTPFGGRPLDALPYGSSVERGPYRCESARTGVTCRNTDTGAGFVLSRERYELLTQ